MAVVYLRSNNGAFLALDVTTNVSKTRSASITSSSIQSGASIADGYTIGNPSITFTGLCTDTKIRTKDGTDDFLNPFDLDLEINDMVESQERFILYGNDLIPNLEDVVITNYSVTQGQYLDTLEVTLTVEQVFISESARLSDFTSTLKPSSTTNGAYEQEKDNGDGKKVQEDVELSFSERIYNYYFSEETGIVPGVLE
jgi:hypothetical protein